MGSQVFQFHHPPGRIPAGDAHAIPLRHQKIPPPRNLVAEPLLSGVLG